jgi:hypothetical protein
VLMRTDASLDSGFWLLGESEDSDGVAMLMEFIGTVEGGVAGELEGADEREDKFELDGCSA